MAAETDSAHPSYTDLVKVFTRIGLLSFGGPAVYLPGTIKNLDF